MVRIALIDDDLDFTILVSELLSDNGYEVESCTDEADAVQCVKNARPDLILLDVRMRTRESGWQILEALQADPQTAATPVIVCSAALDDLRNRAAWLEERGSAMLPKPFDIDDLLSLIEALLGGDPPGDPHPQASSDQRQQQG